MDFTIEPLAEDALLLRFGDTIDPAINARVHAATRALRDAALPGVVDIAPAYASLLLRFDPLQTETDQLAAMLSGIIGSATAANPASTRTDESGIIEIPVCYGGEFGPDLDTVAAHAGLSRDDVIARHTAAVYSVAMLGFAPGFPYLLGLDPALHVPRRANPRTRVPAGSVAIGGAQTGIYPRELPGGWNLIGRMPATLFDARQQTPCLLAPSDRVRFRAIDAGEFARFAEQPA